MHTQRPPLSVNRVGGCRILAILFSSGPSSSVELSVITIVTIFLLRSCEDYHGDPPLAGRLIKPKKRQKMTHPHRTTAFDSTLTQSSIFYWLILPGGVVQNRKRTQSWRRNAPRKGGEGACFPRFVF